MSNPRGICDKGGLWGPRGMKPGSHTPAACSFPGENARSWGALGEEKSGIPEEERGI